LAVRYFIETRNYGQAQIHLRILQDLDYDLQSIDYLEILLATSKIVDAKTENTELQKGRALPTGSNTLAPKYNLNEIKQLFTNDEISKSDLKKLSKLPRKELTDDLNILLNDAIDRFSEHCRNEEYYFVINALLLCGEIRAEECNTNILNLLSQNDELLDFYLSDYLTEMLWEVLFRTGQNKIEDLVSFLKNNGNYTFSKSEVAKTLGAMYLSDLSMRNEIKTAFKDVLAFYLGSGISDSTFTGLFICTIDDCGLFPYFRNEVEILFKNGKVDANTCGTLSELKSKYNSMPQKSSFQFFS